MNKIIPLEAIERRIFFIRREKIMLSTDLAELYGVEPKVLVQAIKRNGERFPADFMFQLTNQVGVVYAVQILMPSPSRE